jgi:PAS domain S-box-containing protein
MGMSAGIEMSECITLDLKQSFGDLNECVLVTNADRTIIFVNKAMEDLLRASSDELLGTTTERFFADPEQFENMADLYKSPSDQRHRKAYALELKLGDGTSASVEVVSAPLFDSQHRDPVHCPRPGRAQGAGKQAQRHRADAGRRPGRDHRGVCHFRCRRPADHLQ